MSYIDFYHYTSNSGKEGIESSKKIRRTSDSRHKWYGEGTYGTSMSPSNGKRRIADNNWIGSGSRKIDYGYVEWAIKVRIPASEVTHHGGSRDILKHEGPIDLNKYIWEAIRVTIP